VIAKRAAIWTGCWTGPVQHCGAGDAARKSRAAPL